MSKKIAIVDYSLGNLFSVQQAFTQCGAETIITDKADVIWSADAIVLPGVGAFATAMESLSNSKLDLAIKDSVLSGKQLFGICLGMQLLFETSEEFGATQGLNIIPGEIKKFTAEPDQKLHVPQVGWNTIESGKQDWINTSLKDVSKDSYMYFVHSYYAVPKNETEILCMTTYGNKTYCSAVLKDNVFATQFHPEKSGAKGLSIYKNWLNKI